MKKIVLIILGSLCLMVCTGVVTGFTIEESITENEYMSMVQVPESDTVPSNQVDTAYWVQRNINEDDFKLWDLKQNTDVGCTFGELSYDIQWVSPTDMGYPLGKPVKETIADMVTQYLGLWQSTGIVLNSTIQREDDTSYKYKTMQIDSFSATDTLGTDWTWLRYNYSIEENGVITNTFNLMGMTPYKDDWLILELSCKTTPNNLKEYIGLLDEFREHYNISGEGYTSEDLLGIITK